MVLEIAVKFLIYQILKSNKQQNKEESIFYAYMSINWGSLDVLFFILTHFSKVSKF